MIGLLSAVICGSMFGVERKIRNKSAGLKTMILICVGSAIYTHLSMMFEGSDPLRVIGQIVTGIGFLGAGVIFQDRKDHISGLTTAALIWLVAAIGILCGMGLGLFAVGLSAGLIILLAGINWFERKMFPLSSGEAATAAREADQKNAAEPALN